MGLVHLGQVLLQVLGLGPMGVLVAVQGVGAGNGRICLSV